ncbi:MAG TPA: shikimate dehydrogenase [Chloroflexota bacterium]|nr:shikimate dehydrogenase [Chloroflexota bacterium]
MRVGLIGFPVRHSVSPAFQQAAFDALGIDARYELWETPPDRLQDVVERLRRTDCLGANVTIPHKQAMLERVDRVDEVAAAIGAINTIVRQQDGSLSGYNTDVAGFERAVRQDGDARLEGARVVLLGAGGAARAVVAAALANHAAELSICARRPAQAEALLADLARRGGVTSPPRPLSIFDGEGERTSSPLHRRWRGAGGEATPPRRLKVIANCSDALEAAVRGCDVLVNATPVGMSHQDALLIHADWLSSRMLVCDLVYNPPVTPLLRAVQSRGARGLNGLPMLIYQGAAAFERWTGRAAPVELMRQAALEGLRD